MIKKINNYLSEFDYIKQVKIGNNELIVIFECINGGSYEMIYLEIIFKNPYVYKLPYSEEGIYIIEEIDVKEQQLVEKELIDGFERMYLIKNNQRNLTYFVMCDDLDIKITGNNYRIINEKELKMD